MERYSIMFEEIKIDQIQNKVSSLMKKGRLVFSNYYGIDTSAQYEILETSQSIVLKKKEVNYSRLYVLSIDSNDLLSIFNSLPYEDKLVINIPSKREITDWVELFAATGFSKIGEYNRYYNKIIKERKSAIGDFAQCDDVDDVYDLLYDNFSPMVDYLPSRCELEMMVSNHQVLVDYDENRKVCGTLIYTIEGQKCYFNAWIDKGNNGLFLLYKVYNIVAEHGIKYTYFWVDSKNEKVIKLHLLMGAAADGLKDYTYIK